MLCASSPVALQIGQMRFLNTGHAVFPRGPLIKWWMFLQNEHCGRRYGTRAKQRLCAFRRFVLTLGLIISGSSTGAQAFSCPSPFSLSFTCIWMHLGCFSEMLTISSSSPCFSSLSLPLCTSSAKPKWSCHVSNGLNYVVNRTILFKCEKKQHVEHIFFAGISLNNMVKQVPRKNIGVSQSRLCLF